MTLQRCDPRMRLRLWINGSLASETWFGTGNEDHAATTDRLLGQCAELIEAQPGCAWLAEVFDPSKPAGCAYERFAHMPGSKLLVLIGDDEPA